MATEVPVISGVVTLDTAPFLTALASMQASVTAAVAKMQETFATLGLGTGAKLESAAVGAGRVSTTFRAAATDTAAFSGRLKEVETNLRNTENAFNSIYRAGAQLSSFGTRLTALGVGIQGILGASMAAASGFDFWARRAAAATQATDAMGNAIGDATVQFQGISRAIEGVAESVGIFSPAQVAQAYQRWVTATGEVIDSQDKLAASAAQVNVILKAAAMEGVDATTAVRGIAGILGEFGASVDQTGQVTAQLLNITQNTDTTFSDMLGAMKMVGPTAKTMNLDLSQTIAVVGELAQSNLKGTVAGRGLQRVLTGLEKPSTGARTALQQLTDQAGYVGKSWQEVLFPGNQFVGMLDQINNGVITQKGFIGILNDALQHMGTAQGNALIAQIETQNGLRVLIPLIDDYRKGVSTAADGTKTGANEMESYAAQLANGSLQTKLFNEQWGTVSQSIEVVAGQQLTRLKFGLIDLGEAAKGAVIPFLTSVANIVEGIRNWASQNTELFMGIIKVVGAVGGIAIGLGTLLIILGQLTQAISSLRVAGDAIRVVFLALSTPLLPLVAALTAVGLAILALSRYAQDSSTISTLFQAVGQSLKDFGAVATNVLGQFISLLQAVFHGDYQGAWTDAQNITLTAVAGLVNIFSSIKNLVSQVLNDLVTWLDQTFNGLGTNMKTWGENIIAAFANGMGSAISKYVVPAINAVIQTIANFLEGHSPAKEGPLSQVDQWGKNIMTAYVEGMKNADFSAVQDALSQVKDALTNDAGLQEGSKQYNDIMTSVNQTVGTIIQAHKDLASVGQDTWNALTATLGSGYVAALQTVIADTQKVQDIKDQQSAIKMQISQNQQAVQKIEATQVNPLQNKIDANNLKKQNLELDKADAQFQLDQYNIQKAADQDQIAFWDDKKAAAQVTLDGYQAEIDHVNAIRQGIQDQINAINDQTTAINDQISTIQRRYNEEHAQQNLTLALMKDQLDLSKSIEDQKMQPLNDQAKTLQDKIKMTKEAFTIQEAPLKLQIEELKASGNKTGAAALQKELSMISAQHSIAASRLQNQYDLINHQITVATMAYNDTQKPAQDQYTAAKDAKTTQDAQQKLGNEALLSGLNQQKSILEDQKLALNVQLHSSDATLHGLEALKNGVTITIKGYDEKIAAFNNDIRQIDALERPIQEHIRALDLQIGALNLANQHIQSLIDGIRRIQEEPFKLIIQGLQDKLSGEIQAALDAATGQLLDAKNQLMIQNNLMRKGPAAPPPLPPTDPNGAMGPGQSNPYNPPGSAGKTLAQDLTNGLGSNGQPLVVNMNPFGPLSDKILALKQQIAGQFQGAAGGAEGFLGGLLGHFGIGGGPAPTAPGGFKGLPGRLGGSMGSLDYQGAVATYQQQLAAYQHGQSTYNNFSSGGSSISNFVMPALGALRFPDQIGGLLGGAGKGLSSLLGGLGGGLGDLSTSISKIKEEGAALAELKAQFAGITDEAKMADIAKAIKALEDSLGPMGQKLYGVISKIDELSNKLRLPGLKDGEAALNGVSSILDRIVAGPGKALLDVFGKIGGGLLSVLTGAAEKVRTAFVGVILLLNTLFDPFISKIQGTVRSIGFIGKEIGIAVGDTLRVGLDQVGRFLSLVGHIADPFKALATLLSGPLLEAQLAFYGGLAKARDAGLAIFGIFSKLHDLPGIRGIGDLIGGIFNKLGALKDFSLGKLGDLLGGGKGLAGDVAGGIGKMLADLGGGAIGKVGEVLKTILFPFSFIIDHGKQFEGVFAAIRTVFDGVFAVGSKVGETLLHFVGILEKIPVLGQLLKALPVVGEIVTIIQIVETLRKAWTSDWLSIQEVVSAAWAKIHPEILAIQGLLAGKGGLFGNLSAILPHIANIAGDIFNAFGQLIANLQQWLGANIPVWRQNIADNLAGIFEGLRDWWAKYGPDTLATVGGFFANLIGGLLNFILNNAIPWSLNLLAGFYQVVANLFTSLDNAITSDGGVQGQGSFGDWLGKIMTNLFAWIGANYQTWAKNIFGALVLMFGAMVNLLLAAGKLLADIAAWFGKIMLGLIAYVLANAPDWAQQIFAHFQTLMGHLRDLLFGDSQSTTGGMLGRLVDWFGNLKDNLIAWIGKNKDQWGADVKDLFVALISKMAQLLVTAALDVVVFGVWFSVMVLKLLATILTSLPGWIGTLKDHFVSWITGASDALNKDPQPGQNLFQTFWNMLTNLLGAIKKFVTTDLLPGLEDIGGSIVNGIISGVEKGAKGFMSRVQAALHGQLTGGGGSDGGSNAPATSRDASVYKNPVIASWENGYPMYKEGGGGGGYAGMAEEEIAAAAKAMEDSYAYGSGAHTYCERFVANIEGRAVQDTAIAAYYARVARNQIQQGGDPPPGAEVYFAAASSNENQGHIGISLGNGRFESVTVDGIRDYSISDWNANTWGAPYLGWVPAGTPMYANGTDFHPGGLAVVGDGGGPELVNLPRGSQVIPSHKVSSALSSSIADTANLVGSIAHALSAGLSDVSAAVRQASSQPVQITKVSNVYIDSQYLSSEAEGAAFAEQMRYMGV